MSKQVLVTGAAGFLGHHFMHHLLKATDWEIVGISSFRHRGCPLRLRELVDEPRVRIVVADLGAPMSDRLIERIGPIDYCVNFASESHVDRSIATPRPFVLNNVEVAVTMLDWARAAKPEVFIQFSTDEVYGPAPDNYQHTEYEAIIPSNPYSASKACQEAIAISYWRTYQVPVLIVNSMNLFGERQEPEKLIPVAIRKILAGEQVPIYGASEGEVGSRMYLHARNLANALTFLLGRGEPAAYPEVDRPDRWHVVGEREVNNLEMAKLIASIVGKPLRYELVPMGHARPGHDRRYALDGTKIADAGWHQPMDFERSLASTVRWTLQNREWLR